MTEIEQLVLEVTSSGLDDVNAKLDKLTSQTGMAQAAFGKLTAQIIGIVASGEAIKFVVDHLLEATKTYEALNAQLVTVTRSQEGANTAMAALVAYTQTTPTSLDAVTQAFIRLVNMGMDPSEKALTAYGNIAAATGHTLGEVINSASRAMEGQYRGLITYGIQIKKQGDELAVTFQGQKTLIDGNAASIQKYLLTLGETHFADAMAEKMKTLGGQISVLSDVWQQLWINLSKEGAGSLITEAVQMATQALRELNSEVASGQIDAELKAMWGEWSWVFHNITTSLLDLNVLFARSTAGWGTDSKTAMDDWRDTWKYFPIYAKGALDIAAIDFDSFTSKVSTWYDKLVNSTAGPVAKLKDYLQTGDAAGVNDRGKSIDDQVAAQNAALDALQAKRDAADKQFIEGPGGVGDQINADKAAADKLVNDALAQRDAYDKKNAAAAASVAGGKDPLKGFQQGHPNDGPSEAQIAADRKLQEDLLKQDVAMLAKGLASENVVVADSFKEREEIILKNSKLTADQQKNLILVALSQSLMSEEDNIKQSYDKRKQFILSDTQLTESQKTTLVLAMTRSREQAVLKIEIETMDKRLTQASQFFGNIASIGSTFGKKGFEIAKAAGIAQATIDTYKAATGAYAAMASIPYIGPELGIAAAAAAVVAGAANIAKISSTNYSGAYALGGMIPSGKYGIVGEAGPEFVQGPAVVTGASATAAALNGATGVHTVIVQNHGAPAVAESVTEGGQLMVILRPLLAKNKADTKLELAQEVKRGGSDFSRAQEEVYGLRRAAR